WDASKAETASKTQILKDNGIAVAAPSDALQASMKEIGATMVGEWKESAGADGTTIVEAFSK
ncbi:MAG: C4-dicarboxylate ABC transporter substrate-binding protein, partial [Roseibium sp.]